MCLINPIKIVALDSSLPNASCTCDSESSVHCSFNAIDTRVLVSLKTSTIFLVDVFSLIVFAFCMIYRPFDYFGLYLHLPFGVSFLEELLLAFTNVTWVIYISGGVATSSV